MANSARDIVQMAFNLVDGGARAEARRSVDAALKEAEGANAEPKQTESSGADFVEEKLEGGKVRLSCYFNVEENGGDGKKEEAVGEEKVAESAQDNGELTPVSDTMQMEMFAIVEDANETGDVKTTAENCEANNVLTCPYHGPERVEGALASFLDKRGISNVAATAEYEGSGKFRIFAVCNEEDAPSVKEAMSAFSKETKGEDLEKAEPKKESYETVESFKMDWYNKDAKCDEQMHASPAKADEKETPDIPAEKDDTDVSTRNDGADDAEKPVETAKETVDRIVEEAQR